MLSGALAGSMGSAGSATTRARLGSRPSPTTPPAAADTLRNFRRLVDTGATPAFGEGPDENMVIVAGVRQCAVPKRLYGLCRGSLASRVARDTFFPAPFLRRTSIPEAAMTRHRLLVFAIAPLAFSRLVAQEPDSGIVTSKNGMVVSTSAPASDVGAAILKKGGNAIDAAVATAFALAVTHPSAGNIGGGGFMVYRPVTGEPMSYDFREVGPQKS